MASGTLCGAVLDIRDRQGWTPTLALLALVCAGHRVRETFSYPGIVQEEGVKYTLTLWDTLLAESWVFVMQMRHLEERYDISRKMYNWDKEVLAFAMFYVLGVLFGTRQRVLPVRKRFMCILARSKQAKVCIRVGSQRSRCTGCQAAIPKTGTQANP